MLYPALTRYPATDRLQLIPTFRTSPILLLGPAAGGGRFGSAPEAARGLWSCGESGGDGLAKSPCPGARRMRARPPNAPQSVGAAGPHVRQREIVALVEQRHAAPAGAGVGEAVARVQPRGVAALAEAGVGVQRERRLLRTMGTTVTCIAPRYSRT